MTIRHQPDRINIAQLTAFIAGLTLHLADAAALVVGPGRVTRRPLPTWENWLGFLPAAPGNCRGGEMVRRASVG
ncbi:hypothetical protein [Glaciihabitans sp. UYNi722]|uniref:hypothetical protein n=1 Tax=Glaciihabitans sp. UYNi722 TaxID=3156344 RepID=UPI00339B7643